MLINTKFKLLLFRLLCLTTTSTIVSTREVSFLQTWATDSNLDVTFDARHLTHRVPRSPPQQCFHDIYSNNPSDGTRNFARIGSYENGGSTLWSRGIEDTQPGDGSPEVKGQ